MYLGKKKIIITAVVIAIIVITLIIGGLYIVLATDLLKPADLMFFKYANMEYEKLINLKDDTTKELLTARNKMPYELDSNVEIDLGENTVTYNMYNVDTQSNESNSIKLNINLKEDVKNDKQLLNLKASYNNNNLLDISYAKSNNIIALKWEEIVKKYFIGIENENIQDFVKRLGVQNADMIPNKIEDIDYLDLITITEEEKAHIFETYSNVIINNIPKQNYTKQKDSAILKDGITYNTTAYRLDLTQEEIRNIEVKVLQTLKEDSITLNLIATKAKVLGLGEDYTKVNNLVKQIDEVINNINSTKIDASKGLSIVFYEYQGKVLQTEIMLKNYMKIVLDSNYENNTQNVKITLTNLSDEEDFDTAIMKITKQKLENNIIENVSISIDNKQSIKVNKTSSGSVTSGINTNMDINIENEEDQSINVSANTKIKFGELQEDIINLEHNKNCIVLNNYTDTKLQNLLNQITSRIGYVIGQKLQILMGINTTTSL